MSLQSVFRTFIDRGKPVATACFCIALFLFAASTLYGQEAVEQYYYGRKALFREAVVQYYIPSSLGIVSGEGAVFHQIKEVVKSRFLVPVETKMLLATLFDEVGLSGLGTVSAYFEDGALGSFNISLGVGFHLTNLAKTSFLQGPFISLYPMYEFPLVQIQAGSLMVDWKAAFDIGFGVDVFSTPLYVSVYWRTMLFWMDSSFAGGFPDFGLTIGWRFKRKFA